MSTSEEPSPPHNTWQQLLCGGMTSAVSSAVYIFESSGMYERMAFSVVVFPDAVSPTTNTVCSFSKQSQRYAASSGESVPQLVIWLIDSVTASPCRIVSEEPFRDTSSE